ncbi:MFS transporter [Shewanella gaetbuli]|uniref:MFS transporter n=1 Tax=Shewanella gaetbuli TaxID=220752 RepID=A0A9X1ZJG7_9GAMM|nr:MFS transporter [Shewanella gaetbuli]MCL1142883.1 MFS transporter [Shewanella gaetbuli]
MINQVDKVRIFNLCCVSLIVTAMTFAIRAGILGDLGQEFGLTGEELGWINAMAFLGFPVATIVGGALYNLLGAKKLITLAFSCHLLGLILTITAGGFWGLLISTFCIGFANGSVEAGCNPLIADLHPENKTTMLNKFHVWFPGGIVIGALISNLMTSFGLAWQLQVAIIIIPTLIYGVMLLKSTFPQFDTQKHSTISNIKSLFSPLYLLFLLCISLTATTELGTQQWIESILGASGASPMLILALITGLMAVGRFYAGALVHRLSPVGTLFFSAIIAAIGIYSMSIATGNMVYLAAILFAIGVTYFWPTVLGCVAEYTPKTGAMGLSVAGGMGMFAVSMWNPVIGGWIDSAKEHAALTETSAEKIDLIAGQIVLGNLVIFPCSLIIIFALLAFIIRKVHSPAKVSAIDAV